MQLIAVSLIGIPGSGKSTLARWILEMSRKDQLEAGVIVICFDDYLKLDYGNIAGGVYKDAREEFVKKVQDFMGKLKESQGNVLKSHEILNIPESNYNLKPNLPVLVILDDNMYFRSMRQRIRAICRSLSCQYFQIYMRSSIEAAAERNKTRKTSVPQEIIDKMFQNLEVPINLRTIFLESSETIDENLLKLIIDRISNPENLEETVIKPKVPQPQSMFHEADLITRKELTKRIKNLSHDSDISQFSARLNRRRKEFLEDLKCQKITFEDVESLRKAFHCYLDE